MDPLAKRKQENIASYVLGMWQVEDLMRALGFNIASVQQQLLADANADSNADLLGWYGRVIARMREQGIERVGHLSEVEEVVNELEYLHKALVEVLNDAEYDALLAKADEGIKTVQQHAGGDPEGPVTSALTAVYGVMMLRSQGKPISPETLASDKALRDLLDHLSKHYRQMRRLPGVSMN